MIVLGWLCAVLGVCCVTLKAQEAVPEISMLPSLSKTPKSEPSSKLPSPSAGPDVVLQILESLSFEKKKSQSQPNTKSELDQIVIRSGQVGEGLEIWRKYDLITDPPTQPNDSRLEDSLAVDIGKIQIQGESRETNGSESALNRDGGDLAEKQTESIEPTHGQTVESIAGSVRFQLPRIATTKANAQWNPGGPVNDQFSLDQICGYAIQADQRTVQNWVDRVFGNQTSDAVSTRLEVPVTSQIGLTTGKNAGPIIKELATMFDHTYSIEPSKESLASTPQPASGTEDDHVVEMISHHMAKPAQEPPGLDSTVAFGNELAMDNKTDLMESAIERLADYKRGSHQEWVDELQNLHDPSENNATPLSKDSASSIDNTSPTISWAAGLFWTCVIVVFAMLFVATHVATD